MLSEKFNVLSMPSTLRRIRGFDAVNKVVESKYKQFSSIIKKLDQDISFAHRNTKTQSDEEWQDIVQSVKKLNERFREINVLIKDEVKRQYKVAEARVNDNDDWVRDFEIEWEIEFYIGEDDPAYQEDDDNYIARFSDSLSYDSSDKLDDYIEEFYYSNNYDHNEFKNLSDDKSDLNSFIHTFMLHELYDHQHLSFEEISRIKIIWVDFKTIYQYYK